MLTLLDYRQQVQSLYARIRAADDAKKAFSDFKSTRDDLFANHVQSALTPAQKEHFRGLRYYSYDPAYRVTSQVQTDVEQQRFEVDLGEDGIFQYQRIGRVNFTLPTGEGELFVYWIMGYGGGLFLPFRDGTNGTDTYGGGRYLYDTIKGADLNHHQTKPNTLLLDFNFAYNPSCSYNPRWVCPLAPPENHLNIAIPVGEKVYPI